MSGEIAMGPDAPAPAPEPDSLVPWWVWVTGLGLLGAAGVALYRLGQGARQIAPYAGAALLPQHGQLWQQMHAWNTGVPPVGPAWPPPPPPVAAAPAPGPIAPAPPLTGPAFPEPIAPAPHRVTTTTRISGQ